MALNAIVNKGRFYIFIMILLVFGVVLTVFIGYRTDSNPKELFLSSLVQDDATIAIKRVHQTSTKNGVKEWILDAASAQFIEKDRQAVFDKLSMTFFLKNGTLVKLSADKGYLNTDTRDMRVDGDVIADDGELKILTESLDYESGRRVLVAKKPVRIFGRAFRVNADSASYDLSSRKTTFEGNVKGTIFDKIDL